MPIDVGNNQLNSVGANVLAYSNVVTDGLRLYLDAGIANSYPSTGTTWTDLSGYGFNTTLVNGPTYSTGNGGYLSFDDTDDYAEVLSNGNGSLFAVQSFSLETFIYPTVDPDTNEGVIWSFDYPTHTNPYYAQHLRLGGSGGVSDEIGFYWNDGTTYQGPTIGNAFPTLNAWYHVAATYTSGYQGVYVNGALIGNTTRTDTITYFNSPVWIGKANFGGFLAGRMALMRFYNRALSASEVLQNFNANRRRFNI